MTMPDTDHRYHKLVAVIANSTTEPEKDALAAWATQLLDIRTSSLSPAQKARKAISLTSKASVVWPAMKILSRELRRLGWQDRGWAARFGIGGAAVGLALFGGHGAGIAALGTAVGVPLWVVLGSGAAFAGVMVDEFTRRDRGP
jgi:hypothetical protein